MSSSLLKTTAAVALGCLMIAPALADPTPIPDRGPQTGVKDYIGGPATPHPITAIAVPQNPNLAANGTSNIHMDSFMSDVYTTGGPLGERPKLRVTSTWLHQECGSVTFDSAGRIVAVCIGTSTPTLYRLDPDTLDTIASFDLPERTRGSSGLGAGGYFYLDNKNRAVIPTANDHIYVVAERRNNFKLTKDCDVTAAMDGKNDVINSALPDEHGLIWFITTEGVIATVNPSRHCRLKSVRLNETLSKSFSIDPSPDDGGTFIVTDYAMYRFDANKKGKPVKQWRTSYDRGTRVKPGQKSQGSGTTPTLIGTKFGRKFVAITDNADPYEHVVVFDRSTGDAVCTHPVFRLLPRLSDTYNSLIAFTWADKPLASIVVENNYGYRGVQSTEVGLTTFPGIERVDVDTVNRTCRTEWSNYAVSIPTVVSQMSLDNGLIYTYTKPLSTEKANPWYFTGIDFKTGWTVYQKLAGTGYSFNNNYSGVYLSPKGVGYVGVFGGLVRVGEDAICPPTRNVADLWAFN
jgi:hypothetical protein